MTAINTVRLKQSLSNCIPGAAISLLYDRLQLTDLLVV
jgi:hypothetical protein